MSARQGAILLYLSLICPPGGSTGPIIPSPAFHVLGISEGLRTGEDPRSWLSLTPVAPEMVKSIEYFPCKHEDLRSAPKPILEKNILGIVPCACQFSTREVEVGGSLALTVPPAQTYLGNSRTERDPVSKQNEQTTWEEALRLSIGITHTQVNMLIYAYLEFLINTGRMNVIVSLYNIEDLCLKKD